MLNKSDKSNQYNINAQDEKYIKVSYIDDFAIQLKRFGEYNYKYFYSHQELISDDIDSTEKSLSNENWDKEGQNDIYKKPILLGTLVYDKEWLDNKKGE